MGSFEDHMNIVNDTQKTASANEVKSDVLSKLAAELEGGAMAAPSAEGEVVNADTSVAGAAPAVAAQTDGVAVPQEVLAGANPAEKPAGEMPAATKPNEGTVISAGDGKVTDTNSMHKTPESVAAGAAPIGRTDAAAVPVQDGPKNTDDTEKTASMKEAEEIGRTMARSYAAEMQKIATDQQFEEATEILKEAGLLEGYNIKVDLTKTASEEGSALEKIAEKKILSKEDMVQAANEYLYLEKEAADADEAGREAAHEFVAELQKQAEDEEAEEKEEEAAAAPAEEKKEEAEKTSSDVELVGALKVLRAKGLLK